MDATTPPALRTRKFSWKKGVLLLLIGVGSIIVLCGVSIVVLKELGYIQAFSIPFAGMAPAINQGDMIYVEQLTYLVSKPHRGDVIVFQTDGIPSLPAHQFYVKRLVGLPGDTLSITDGVLCVNGQPAIFNGNTVAVPKYGPRGIKYLVNDPSEVKVPNDQYFVLGDNVANSLDSRYFGCLPAKAIVSRAAFCYAPTNRVGWIR